MFLHSLHGGCECVAVQEPREEKLNSYFRGFLHRQCHQARSGPQPWAGRSQTDVLSFLVYQGYDLSTYALVYSTLTPCLLF